MSDEQIKVIGLRPSSRSNVKPKGIHLRWTFPKQLGFPSGVSGFPSQWRRLGDPIKTLSLPTSPIEMLERLKGIGNRYIPDPMPDTREIIARYSNQVESLFLWLQALQNPAGSSLIFEDPTLTSDNTPDKLRLKGDDTAQLNGVKPQSILLLASLDPNIALMLGLYWVDRDDSDDGPKPDEAYDYKIVGKWDPVREGLLLNFGATESQLPLPPINFEMKQPTAYFWRADDKPFCRVGLTWKSPPRRESTQPILFDVYRDNQLLTGEAPVLRPGRLAESQRATIYIDPEVEISSAGNPKEYEYRVTSIDLFGQVGNPSTPFLLSITDLPAPPPPVRLQTWQPGKVVLQFEYGAIQHLQAPNIEYFTLYHRNDTLAMRQRVKGNVVQTREVDGKREYTLSVGNPSTADGSPLSGSGISPLVGDVLTRVHSDPAMRLPARERRQYRIAKTDPDNPMQVTLDPLPFDNEDTLPSGPLDLLLTADPHYRERWSPGLPDSIPYQPPLKGDLTLPPAEPFDVQIVKVPEKPPPSDPFAVLQQDPDLKASLPDSFPILPVILDILEVEIDRDLLDPDIFVSFDSQPDDFSGNGTATIEGTEYKIAYISSGGVDSNGKNKGARLGLKGATNLTAGQDLTLRPRPERRAQVRFLTVSGQVDVDWLGIAGGEILIRDNHAPDSRIVGQVVSSAANQTGAFDMLVRFPAGLNLNVLQITEQVSYYVPYRRVFDIDLTRDIDTPPTLLWAQNCRR